MTFEPRRVRGIVFDLDGTLIDSYDAIAASLNHALEALGHPTFPIAEVRSMVGRGLEVLVARALGEEAATPEAIDRAVRLFRRHYDAVCVEKTRLLPDVATTVGTLERRGYRMSVATNKPSYFARRLLDALSIGSAFDMVIGPDLVVHPKPDPEMVLAAIGAMKVTPPETVCVGDMEIDVQTARSAGVAVVVMPTGSRGIEDLRAAGADRVVERFEDLLDLLPDRVPGPPRI